MPALVAGIRVFWPIKRLKTWMAGTSPAMTVSLAYMLQKPAIFPANKSLRPEWPTPNKSKKRQPGRYHA
jgi:hypothetical protein